MPTERASRRWWHRDAPTEFSRTEREGKAALMARDRDWVILRPSLVVGRSKGCSLQTSPRGQEPQMAAAVIFMGWNAQSAQEVR